MPARPVKCPSETHHRVLSERVALGMCETLASKIRSSIRFMDQRLNVIETTEFLKRLVRRSYARMGF